MLLKESDSDWPIMNFTDQDRQCVVTPPRELRVYRDGQTDAKLALSMTGPVLIGKNHNCAPTSLHRHYRETWLSLRAFCLASIPWNSLWKESANFCTPSSRSCWVTWS